MSLTSNLISPADLKSLLGDEKLRVLDCSWYMTGQQINTEQEYLDKHIQGARFFHIDEVCDQQSDLPHMLPTPADFSQSVRRLGVDNDSDVVVYDSAGLFSAARVWWMFRVFGHQKIRVLDGGLPAWIASSGEVYDTNSDPITEFIVGEFEAQLAPQAIVCKSQLQHNCQQPEALVLDARSNDRFLGTAPEPRAGLPSGHMPHSVSMPFTELLENGRLRPVEQLKEILATRGVNESTKVITSCGSGVTAAIITLALAECGYGLQQLYDGSWAEWASSDDTIILNQL